MDTSTQVSGPDFRICPRCEASRLVFSGLYSARCPTCGCEPSEAFMETLCQIVALPEVAEPSRHRPTGNPRVVPEEDGNTRREGGG